MATQFDPGTHTGHIERGIALIKQDGGCVCIEDEFSRTSLALSSLPTCGPDSAVWTITTTPTASAQFTTDGWHFSTIYFVKENQ